jgi:hypothetical protein
MKSMFFQRHSQWLNYKPVSVCHFVFCEIQGIGGNEKYGYGVACSGVPADWPDRSVLEN